MNDVTITFAAIPAETIAQLTETETLLAQTEQEFVTTLRKKYTPLARLNGFIKVSFFSIGDCNWGSSGETHYQREGKPVKALLASDNFTRKETSQHAGIFSGSRLYLTEFGEWLEVVRSGHWSKYQGSPNYWTADGDFADGGDDEWAAECDGAAIRVLSDWQVADEYSMPDLAVDFANTLKDMAEKLPERLTRKRALAGSLITAISALRG